MNVKTYSPTVRPASKIVQNTKEAPPNLQAGTDRGAKSQYMADVMAYGKDGAATIQQHAFFHGLDWAAVLAKAVPGPLLSRLTVDGQSLTTSSCQSSVSSKY